jgi:hypothetical protein
MVLLHIGLIPSALYKRIQETVLHEIVLPQKNLRVGASYGVKRGVLLLLATHRWDASGHAYRASCVGRPPSFATQTNQAMERTADRSASTF